MSHIFQRSKIFNLIILNFFYLFINTSQQHLKNTGGNKKRYANGNKHIFFHKVSKCIMELSNICVIINENFDDLIIIALFGFFFNSF